MNTAKLNQPHLCYSLPIVCSVFSSCFQASTHFHIEIPSLYVNKFCVRIVFFFCCSSSAQNTLFRFVSFPFGSAWLAFLRFTVFSLIMTELNLDSLRRRANARNVSFRISLRWLTYIVNSVDKTRLSWNLKYVHSMCEVWENN